MTYFCHFIHCNRNTLSAGDQAAQFFFISRNVTSEFLLVFSDLGESNVNDEHMQRLYLELTSLENRGITIWLEGAKSSSQDVASQLCVQEESTYMRDYIFDEGVLKEVHFDKIRKDLP